jgi:sensor domain CHASE-containing protein/nitrogen-specific signal transduction histidine kinase
LQIRTALPIIIIFLLLAIAGGLIVSMQLVMLPGLEGMEADYAKTNLERGLNAIDNDAENLQILVKDWASWDDSYRFIQDKNERYLESNFVDDTFINSRINFVIYFDRKGDIVFARGFDYKEDLEEIAVPSQLVDQLRDLEIVGSPDTILETHNGLITLPEVPLLVATAPILKSDESGPPRGTLVMARYFDRDEVISISEQVSTSISLYRLGNEMAYQGLVPLDTLPDSDRPIVAITEDATTISAIAVINDIAGTPAYTVRADMDREAYRIALESMFSFLFVVAFIGLISSILVIVVVRNRFIVRLESLKSQIEEIGKKQDFSGEVRIEGDDELASLSVIFNRVLRALEEHISEQKLAEKQARTASEKLHLLTSITRHDILNQITVIRGHTDMLFDRKEDSDLLEHVKEIDKAVENIDTLINFTRDYEKMGISNPEWQDVESLIQVAIDNIQTEKLEIDVSVGNLRIFADPLLERVFYNLIDNTIRHGRNATRISVTSHKRDDRMILVFEDNGCGVPDRLKNRLFEKGVGENTGLGLFLSREILNITGISIYETGIPGKGARFEIDIPFGCYRI